jgi:hypothetical protein
MGSRIGAFVVVFAILIAAETAHLWIAGVPVVGEWHWGRTQAAGQILLALVGLLLVAGSFRGAYRLSGISRNPLTALIFAALATSPLWATLALTSEVSPAIDWNGIILFGVLFPFGEEFFYRGFAFAVLYRRARLGFWASALIPTALFAAGHLYQADSPADAAMTMAITGAGSLVLCWVYMKWNFNLWVPVFAHIIMNAAWEIFAVGEGAFAGLAPALLQVASMAAAILLTLVTLRLGLLGPKAQAGAGAPAASG